MHSGNNNPNGLSRLNKSSPSLSHDDASSADNRKKQATLASAGNRDSLTKPNHWNPQSALIPSPPRLHHQSSSYLADYPRSEFTPVKDKKRMRYRKKMSQTEDSPPITTPVRPPLKKVKSEPQSDGKQQLLELKKAPAPHLKTKARDSIRGKRMSLQPSHQSGDNSKNRFSTALKGTANLPKVKKAPCVRSDELCARQVEPLDPRCWAISFFFLLPYLAISSVLIICMQFNS